jgi:hypothetical protein
MPQEALNLLVTEERYWALFYMPLYTFIHNLLNVLVQIRSRKPRLRPQGIRRTDHTTTLYPQEFALTSPIRGGRSVGTVRSRTKATELLVQIANKTGL